MPEYGEDYGRWVRNTKILVAAIITAAAIIGWLLGRLPGG